jgi:hypothetical protein
LSAGSAGSPDVCCRRHGRVRGTDLIAPAHRRPATAELAAELVSEGLASKAFLEHRPPDAGMNRLFPRSH